VIPLGFGNFSTPTLWNNNLFAAGASGPVHSYQLNTSTAQFSSTATSTHTFGFPGATLSVSAAANQNGVVWAIDSHSYCTAQARSCGAAVLYAYDAGNVANELWNSATVAADRAGNAIKFSVPTVASGRVFIGTRGTNAGGANSSTSVPGELEIYGLLQ
jgi:outer membrane protein assembly factor BamB